MPRLFRKQPIAFSSLLLFFLLLIGLSLPQFVQTPSTASEQVNPRPTPALIRGERIRRDLPPIGVSVEKDGAGRMNRVLDVASTCSKNIDLTSTLRGVTSITAQENGICYNADIDVYSRDGRTYVVQAGGWDAAWTHTDVTDPANPQFLHQSTWDRATYTPDIKAFTQGDRQFIAISMERFSTGGYCGVAIYDMSDPAAPALQSHVDGGTDWCDVHNLFVEDDSSGDGAYIYITAMLPHDMRVLDIGGAQGGSVTEPAEIGRYSLPGSSYIHDITVLDHTEHSGGAIGRRVYISYWERGLVILDADDVTPGINPQPVVAADTIDPVGFRTHHAMASPDGRLVFTQDEFLRSAGSEPVQMWNVSAPANPVYVDGLRLGRDVPDSAAHNLETVWDIHPNRLYVGWYKQGLQAWNYSTAGFLRQYPEPRTSVIYHQVQTGATDHIYSGAWGVRLAHISNALYVFQSDYRYGLIIDRLNETILLTPTPSNTVTPIAPPTETQTPTLTLTLIPTATPTVTSTVSITATIAPTSTATMTPTLMPSITPTATVTISGTVTPTATPVLTGTVEPPQLNLPLQASQIVSLMGDADKSGAASPGDTLVYIVTIKNASDETMMDAVFFESMSEYLLVPLESIQHSAGTNPDPGTVLLPGVEVLIDSIAPGETVTITFDAVIDPDLPLGVVEIQSQGTVRSNRFDGIQTDNPLTDSFGDADRIEIIHPGVAGRVYLPLVSR